MEFFFIQKNLSVEIIKQWSKNELFSTAGVLIKVRNGKNVLKESIGEYENKGYITITLHDEPLMQIHGDEYFCPTCEKIIRSGFQLKHDDVFKMKGLNTSKEVLSLNELVKQLVPLWGLLSSGYYVIHDTELYPTDGNGHLFWNFPNENTPLLGSCPVYFGNGRFSDCFPKYTIATESRNLCNENQVLYYRKYNHARALAYYIEGYYCALLDGHHKMLAAARNGTLCNALVIERCSLANNSDFYHLNSSIVNSANYIDFKISKKLSTKVNNSIYQKISKEEMVRINRAFLLADTLYPYIKNEIEKNAYPSIEQTAAIEYIGDDYKCITEDIINNKQIPENENIDLFFKVMPILSSYEQCKAFAKLLVEGRISNHNAFLIIKEIVKLRRDEELEQILIDTYIAYDDCDYIKNFLSEHL